MAAFFASPATEIIVTLLATLASGALAYFLFKGIAKEKLKYLAISNKGLTITGVEIKQIATREINSSRPEFVMIEISLNDMANLEKVCGETQLQQALDDLIGRARMTLPRGAKFSKIDNERIWIFYKGKMKYEQLQVALSGILAEIKKPIVLIGSLNVEFEANISALVYEKGMGDLNTISGHLELATITSRKRGPNNAVIFDRSIANITTEEYTLYTEIKEAIKNKDFRIYYQPIVNNQNLECFAVEAFLRWQHSTKGVISPDVFMPSLEHSGDINWVGLWAFDDIAKQLEYWRLHNPDVKIKVNVNWSLTQLQTPALHEEIRKILRKYKINASDFYFEIPSYKTAQSLEAVARNLTIFRQLGIGIAIDNMNLDVDTIMELGTDTVNMLKFNRNFITRLNSDNEAVKNVAEMIAKSTAAKNILIVGEGVENEEMLAKLKEVEIPLSQGYFFSKPKSPSEAMADILMTPWKK